MEYSCLNCRKLIRDTPSKHRKFCSNRCRLEHQHKFGLPEEHRKALSDRIQTWWDRAKIEAPEVLVERNRRIALALKRIPEEKQKERYAKIAKANRGRLPGNLGFKTGSSFNCLQCGKSFYRTPKDKSHLCSRACWREYNRVHWFELHHTSRKRYPREVLIRAGNSKCEVCGYEDTRVLVAHHRDFNGKNDSRENMSLVCPTCHTRLHLDQEGRIDFRKLRS